MLSYNSLQLPQVVFAYKRDEFKFDKVHQHKNSRGPLDVGQSAKGGLKGTTFQRNSK